MKYLVIALLLAVSSVFAQSAMGHIDLTGGSVIAEPVQCQAGKNAGVCVLVEKDKKHYMVILDEQGEFEIYSVTVTVTLGGIQLKNVKLIWSRKNTI